MAKEGLKHKYNITKADGSPVDPSAEYFVLRLDDSGGHPEHIKACRKALMVYAEEIQKALPELARDLKKKWYITGDFNFDEWLKYHDGPDSYDVCWYSDEECFIIRDYDGNWSGTGKTLEEACNNYIKDKNK